MNNLITKHLYPGQFFRTIEHQFKRIQPLVENSYPLDKSLKNKL